MTYSPRTLTLSAKRDLAPCPGGCSAVLGRRYNSHQDSYSASSHARWRGKKKPSNLSDPVKPATYLLPVLLRSFTHERAKFDEAAGKIWCCLRTGFLLYPLYFRHSRQFREGKKLNSGISKKRMDCLRMNPGSFFNQIGVDRAIFSGFRIFCSACHVVGVMG